LLSLRIWRTVPVFGRIIKSRLDFKNMMRRRYKDLLLWIASWDWSSSLTRKFLEYIIGIVLSTVVKIIVRLSERGYGDGFGGRSPILIKIHYTSVITSYPFLRQHSNSSSKHESRTVRRWTDRSEDQYWLFYWTCDVATTINTFVTILKPLLSPLIVYISN